MDHQLLVPVVMVQRFRAPIPAVLPTVRTLPLVHQKASRRPMLDYLIITKWQCFNCRSGFVHWEAWSQLNLHTPVILR
jgi:hypothetical protein